MNTLPDEAGVAMGRRRRRNHSSEFKAQVVAAYRPTGVSIAAVAMANGVNANLARRWVRDAEQPSVAKMVSAGSNVAPTTFVPLTLPAAVPAPADIRIEVRRGAAAISVSWPCAAAPECAAWMRELLR